MVPCTGESLPTGLHRGEGTYEWARLLRRAHDPQTASWREAQSHGLDTDC
jgi:hypothetical protein